MRKIRANDELPSVQWEGSRCAGTATQWLQENLSESHAISWKAWGNRKAGGGFRGPEEALQSHQK